MNFLHSQEQLALRDGAGEFLQGVCTPELLRDYKNQPSLWPQIVELGLPAVLAPESIGGLGLDSNAFVLLAEQAGRVALPEPLVEVAGVSVPLLLALGELDRVRTIVAGDTRILVKHEINPFINQLKESDHLLLFTGQQIRLFAANELQLEKTDSVDPLRELSIITATDGGIKIADANEQYNTLACHYGAVFTAAELLGLTEAMIDMSTSYAQHRQQFGNAIGRYQAVKHHLASARVKLEFARPVVYAAACLLGSDEANLPLAVAHAKLAANDAANFAAEVAIQVHGAMGYTYEVDLHMWMKRVWALSGLWGSRSYHMKIVEQTVFANLNNAEAGE